ncbi:hypothetical protein GCM10027361_17010 [Erwinia aphidicola]
MRSLAVKFSELAVSDTQRIIECSEQIKVLKTTVGLQSYPITILTHIARWRMAKTGGQHLPGVNSVGSQKK